MPCTIHFYISNARLTVMRPVAPPNRDIMHPEVQCTYHEMRYDTCHQSGVPANITCQLAVTPPARLPAMPPDMPPAMPPAMPPTTWRWRPHHLPCHLPCHRPHGDGGRTTCCLAGMPPVLAYHLLCSWYATRSTTPPARQLVCHQIRHTTCHAAGMPPAPPHHLLGS